MKLLLCIAVLSTAVLAEGCTGDAATELNKCLDGAYGKGEDCKEDTKCVCDSAQEVVKCFDPCPEGDFYKDVVKYAEEVCKGVEQSPSAEQSGSLVG